MTPESSQDLTLIGFTFEAAYMAGEGIILRLQPPPKIALSESDPIQPCLHIAFIPATNVKYSPPVEGESEMEPSVHKILIMKTHAGELPAELQQACQQMTDFDKLSGLVITAATPTDDGSSGLNLIFGFQYRLQIDLAGAFVYAIADGIRA